MNRSHSHDLSYDSFSFIHVKRDHKPFHQQTASHRPPLWPLHSLYDRGEELWLEYYQKEENNFFRCRRWSLDLLSLPLSMLKMKPGRALTTGILSRLGLAHIYLYWWKKVRVRQDHLMYTNSFPSPSVNWFPCVGLVYCIMSDHFFRQDHLMYTNNFPQPSGCVGQVRYWGKFNNWSSTTTTKMSNDKQSNIKRQNNAN